MNGLKQIMYGVTDFPLMRKENAHFVDRTALIRDLETSATLRKSLQAKELGSSDNFISFLFYNGLVTVTESGDCRTRLGIPNQTVGEFMHDFIGRAYGDVYGIAFHPQLDRWPQIAHAALIELKYFKANEKLTRQKLSALKKNAAKRLDKYAANRDLARLWRLTPVSQSNNPTIKQSNNFPSVKLTRLAIVFRGAVLALCEEI